MRLFVVVQDDEIIVTSETGFRTAYCNRPNHPQLKRHEPGKPGKKKPRRLVRGFVLRSY
jgi:hypothetical protein